MTRTLNSALFLTILIAGCGGGGLAAPQEYVSVSGGEAEESTASVEGGGYDGSYEPTAPSPSVTSQGAPSMEPPPEHRPGLATQWGETRYRAVRPTTFVRSDPSRPLALASIHYNDAAGAAIQAARSSGAQPMQFVSLADPSSAHRVRVSLRDEYGRPLPAYVVGGRTFVAGQAGQRYSVTVENMTPFRIEVVASVDGLDVVNGREASLSYRGYVVQPYATISIEGFRQSSETVAAFRFGSVASSYAQQSTGSARNVGVVGVALFGEAGVALPASLVAEAELRERANPFPGQFAAPPPALYVQ
jgi:hypothetical protein